MPLPPWRRPASRLRRRPQKKRFAGRLTHYADHFWLLFEDEKLVSLCGRLCDRYPDLTDEMYADASLHDAHGAWQMIFGVNTLPEYRKQGLAGQLLPPGHRRCKGSGPQGAGAHLRDRLVHYYAGFGFVSEGRFRLHPRRRGVVPDAADLLNFLQKHRPSATATTASRCSTSTPSARPTRTPWTRPSTARCMSRTWRRSATCSGSTHPATGRPCGPRGGTLIEKRPYLFDALEQMLAIGEEGGGGGGASWGGGGGGAGAGGGGAPPPAVPPARQRAGAVRRARLLRGAARG